MRDCEAVDVDLGAGAGIDVDVSAGKGIEVDRDRKMIEKS